MTFADYAKNHEERVEEVRLSMSHARDLRALLRRIERIPEMRRSMYVFRLTIDGTERRN